MLVLLSLWRPHGCRELITFRESSFDVRGRVQSSTHGRNKTTIRLLPGLISIHRQPRPLYEFSASKRQNIICRTPAWAPSRSVAALSRASTTTRCFVYRKATTYLVLRPQLLTLTLTLSRYVSGLSGGPTATCVWSVETPLYTSYTRVGAGST